MPDLIKILVGKNTVNPEKMSTEIASIKCLVIEYRW